MKTEGMVLLFQAAEPSPVSNVADKGIKHHRGNRKSYGTEYIRKIVCSAYCPKDDSECKHSNADNAKDQDSSLLFLKEVAYQIYGTAH